MKDHFEETLKARLQSEAESIHLNELQNRRMQNNIHSTIKRRKRTMFNKNKKVILVAAAIAILGSITAIGAGKVVGYSSSNKDAVNYQTAEDTSKAESVLGAVPKVPQQFTNGFAFTQALLSDVAGKDESGTVVETYPDLTVYYNERLFLNISNPPQESESSGTAIKTEMVGDIQLNAYEDQYLFLPPDAEPSEADLALQEEGRLYISYGTSEEERELFRYIDWNDNGLKYSLNTFEQDIDVDMMMEMAKEVIATE